MKNHQSKTYQCARPVAAPFKVAITGTPMENNLMELWSLLSITAPGLFPNPERFTDYYARPIEKDGDGRPARPAAPPDRAADHAADQGAGRRRPAGEAGAGARGRAAPEARPDLPDPPAARAAEGPRPARRRRPQPVHDPAVADAAAAAVAARRAGRRGARGRAVQRRSTRCSSSSRTWSAAGTGPWSSASSPASCGWRRARLEAAGVSTAATWTARTTNRPAVIVGVQGGDARRCS